ncbi:MAG: hypothetical protein PF694_12410 [Bacteroidetes bacterium]|jgi:antitoxin component YwqK of YwqJK toxin-antitoxin module|nr:hypothetical protein [Bacteroidota bacterium]
MKKSKVGGFNSTAKHISGVLFFSLLLNVFMLTGCGVGNEKSADENLISEIKDLWDNGNPKVVRFYKEENDTKVLVKEKQYYPSGTLSMEGSYKNDLREGEWKSWYEDGSLWSTGYFKSGKRHGEGIVYHPNGKKQIAGTYDEGQRTGLWLAWDEDGNVISEQRFD